MKKQQRIFWLAAGCLILAACVNPSAPPAPGVAPANEGRCDFSAAMTPTAPERYRVWVLFKVDDAQGAAAQFGVLDEKKLTLLTEGGSEYIIVRADVVDGDSNYNLVVPIDAANKEAFQTALERLKGVVGDPTGELHVVEHFPTPPHCSNTYVTADELKGFYLKEYDPAGRHPQSPGANPWG